MRLADTGIWIDYFRQADPSPVQTIENDMLLCHPVIVGDLALGACTTACLRSDSWRYSDRSLSPRTMKSWQ